jgi:anti-anti-sigma regulatory factor
MVLLMAIIASWVRVEEERAVQDLEDACDKLDAADGELVLDFASVRRIDPGAIRAMERLAGAADDKAVKVVLRSVNVEVYKVLKLVRLTRRFSFIS